MGIQTVAVYSDADRNALHVSMADEAIHIGPPAAAESYIVIDKIMDAIKQIRRRGGASGLWLSCRKIPALLKPWKAGNVAFIGPPAGAIEAMGDKITSKKLASEAGVSTVPGHMALIEDAEEAVKISRDIGYPVMIKASAGGGGKGMRLPGTMRIPGMGSVFQERGRQFFGDDRIFIEKFVTQPRHIEIQVLGDSHGNCIYLGERECSIQRRNQKVIEEAPFPFPGRKNPQSHG